MAEPVVSEVAVEAPRARRRGLVERARLAISSAVAAFLGLAPHVLHHVGPLAGAALFAGVAGSLLFGALGLVAAVPLLLRMRRHSGSWRRPLGALVLFAAVFSVSTFVIGPALTGEGDSRNARPAPAPTDRPPPPAHDEHHE